MSRPFIKYSLCKTIKRETRLPEYSYSVRVRGCSFRYEINKKHTLTAAIQYCPIMVARLSDFSPTVGPTFRFTLTVIYIAPFFSRQSAAAVQPNLIYTTFALCSPEDSPFAAHMTFHSEPTNVVKYKVLLVDLQSHGVPVCGLQTTQHCCVQVRKICWAYSKRSKKPACPKAFC